MICTTRGIVFHTVPYSDSRVVSKIYTEDFGLQSFIIRVSRAKGGKIKSNLLQPLTQIELVINNRENRTLQTVREISCNYLYQQIADDIIKTSIALFLSEILYKSIKEEEANRPLFTFISGSLKILDLQQDGVANFH
ncbi:MAG TPA: DNA repair protein RecO, partial [Bacteroidia bacterium]|nr:DNA repair protein RecO [Bacteroidia bacterium]